MVCSVINTTMVFWVEAGDAISFCYGTFQKISTVVVVVPIIKQHIVKCTLLLLNEAYQLKAEQWYEKICLF